jgi:site-specific DNA-methyltransferase (cytosine-N4-specific)
MTVYFAEHDITLHQGAAADVLPTLAVGSVNCVVTSPPYYGLRDYGVDGQIGLEASPGEYVETLRAVFAEVRRVLADDGVLWLNLGDSYVTHDPGGWRQGEHLNPGGRQAAKGSGRNRAGTQAPGIGPKNLLGVPWRVAFALQDDGWTLRNDVIWAKPNAMPESVTDRLSTRYEHVFLFSKSRRYWFDLDAIREPHQGESNGKTWTERKLAGAPMHHGLAGAASFGDGGFKGDDRGRNPGDVWSIATSPYPGAHFATMPAELVRRCIVAGCPPDGTVLDPFAGSGTVGMVARMLLRKSVLIELKPEYCGLIVDRVGQPIFDFGASA